MPLPSCSPQLYPVVFPNHVNTSLSFLNSFNTCCVFLNNMSLSSRKLSRKHKSSCLRKVHHSHCYMKNSASRTVSGSQFGFTFIDILKQLLWEVSSQGVNAFREREVHHSWGAGLSYKLGTGNSAGMWSGVDLLYIFSFFAHSCTCML